jgi:hypothetical protein
MHPSLAGYPATALDQARGGRVNSLRIIRHIRL